ncbi:MAG: hypothetical protein M3552_11830 [Planctomycetota bacterium]|nr:hypothetical protein [Planctomycetaceae bacterium]MDQ3331323.1 hypothetical protein [Planctomycetota bacterium]
MSDDPPSEEGDLLPHYDFDYSKAKPNRFAALLNCGNGSSRMNHLVQTLSDISLPEAVRELREAHEFLVLKAEVMFDVMPKAGPLWGIETKRMYVDLASDPRPAAVRKNRERFGEVVNIVATLERLIPALEWFDRQSIYRDYRVAECHPSTSSAKDGNDLVLSELGGQVVVRCEVCDVASGSAGQNGKEAKDLRSLGCAASVPADGVRRFICTSPEFARAIASPKRLWSKKSYRYRSIPVGDEGSTVLLEVVAAEASLSDELEPATTGITEASDENR